MASAHSELPALDRRADGLYSISLFAPNVNLVHSSTSVSPSISPVSAITATTEKKDKSPISLLRVNMLSDPNYSEKTMGQDFDQQQHYQQQLHQQQQQQLQYQSNLRKMPSLLGDEEKKHFNVPVPNYSSISQQPQVQHLFYSAPTSAQAAAISHQLPLLVGSGPTNGISTMYGITNPAFVGSGLPIGANGYPTALPGGDGFGPPNPGLPNNDLPVVAHHQNHHHDDSTRSAVKELFFPVMLSGFGNMGAGIILDSAQNWTVFRRIPQLIVLVPALLGLKGNVEMTLSSRMATHANLGQLADKQSRKKIVVGNVSLAQCQASAIGLLAPLIAILFTYFHSGDQSSSSSTIQSNFSNNSTNLTGTTSSLFASESERTSSMAHQLELLKILLIMASSVITSGAADLMLSSLMCFIVILSVNKFKVNADNIATPIAASVGDLATMSLLAITSRSLYSWSKTLPWLPVVPIVLWSIIIICSGRIASRNPYTSKLVYTGWTPLLVAMLLQNTSGSVMERFFRLYPTMAAFQPVINGFGGNLVAVQSSRIATYLHRTCKKKQLPSSEPSWFVMPWTVFFGNNKHGKLALILILIAAPLQLPFVFIIRYVTASAVITPAFIITYYVCCTVQVILMLYIGYVFVHLLWRFGFNPDNSSIPILTALADLLGSLLFALGFLFLNSIQDPNTIAKTTAFATSNLNLTIFNATTTITTTQMPLLTN